MIRRKTTPIKGASTSTDFPVTGQVRQEQRPKLPPTRSQVTRNLVIAVMFSLATVVSSTWMIVGADPWQGYLFPVAVFTANVFVYTCRSARLTLEYLEGILNRN